MGVNIQPGELRHKLQLIKLDVQKNEDGFYEIIEEPQTKLYCTAKIKKENYQQMDDVLEKYSFGEFYTYHRNRFIDNDDTYIIRFKNRDWEVMEKYDVDLEHEFDMWGTKTLETPVEIYEKQYNSPEPNGYDLKLIYNCKSEVRLPSDTSKSVGKLKTRDTIKEMRVNIRNIGNKFLPKTGMILKCNHEYLKDQSYEIVKTSVDELFITMTLQEV